MTQEELNKIAFEAFPPKLEGNGMTWPFKDKNKDNRERVISAIKHLEEQGFEISIREKGTRDNSLSKQILEEGKRTVGELEATCKSEVCAYRGKGVCTYKEGEFCPMYE